jgi:hypothetical protein
MASRGSASDIEAPPAGVIALEYMLTLLRKFSTGFYAVGGQSYFHVFPCTISFYSRPNAHSSHLRSHFVRRMLPHLPVDARGSLFEEGSM